jgi:hypothetical protein
LHILNHIDRLQAQGTPAHPYRYTSAWDVAHKTYRADGIRGFYKGLGPTLFKVSLVACILYHIFIHFRSRLYLLLVLVMLFMNSLKDHLAYHNL